MKASYITRRLASHNHMAQIDSLARAEGLANRVERTVNAATKIAVAEALDSVARFDYHGIHRVLERMWQAVAVSIRDTLNAMTQWAYSRSVADLLKTVPQHWFNAVAPSLQLAEAETLVYDPSQPVPPGYTVVGGMLVRIEDEPIRTGISDETLIRELIFPPLDEERIGQIVFRSNWVHELRNLSQQITNPASVASQIVVSQSSGENVQQLTQRLKDQFSLAASSAKRVARTEAMRVAGVAQHDSFQKLGPLRIGFRHLSVLDQNSRPEHAILNGRVYYDDPGPGEPSVDEMVIPPYAERLPNCRCSMTPVLAPPEELNDPAIRAEFENASKQEIPDPSVYDQWFARADEGSRKEAVGVLRYKAATDMLPPGVRPEWTDFVDSDGNLLSRKELYDETDAERLARKSEVQGIFRDREEAVRQLHVGSFLFR
jgi:SPP1 gp7 family putative phage head morphogenesis protein